MTLKDILQETIPETDTWRTIEIIDAQASNVFIKSVNRPFEEPESARKIRFDYFMNELEKARKGFEAKSISEDEKAKYTIEDFDTPAIDGIKKAVFKTTDNERKRLTFDGVTTNYSKISHESKNIHIEVYPIAFSEWIACKSQDFTNAYLRNIGKKPYAGIGVNTIVESIDGFFTLTQRGTVNPNYPGTLFTLGGGLNPKDSVSQGLFSEIVEEAGLKEGTHYDKNNLIITAIGSDKSYMGGAHERAEITAYLKTHATWREIVSAQKKTEKQLDVSGLVPLDTDPNNFISRISMMGSTGELLSSAEMGLIYGWLKKRENDVGIEQTRQDYSKLMNMINQYERQSFNVPKLK